MPLDFISGYADQMDKYGFIPADHAAPKFFPVEARRLFDEKGVELPGYKRIVREDTGDTLHIATDAYRVVTNEEAFGAFEDALRKSTLDLTDMRIGTDYANGGCRVFRQYLLPAHMVEVKPGVEVALRLLMLNSYDGSVAFQGRAGAFNFVCANTSIFGTDFGNFKMRHTGSLDVTKAITGLAQAAEKHIEETRRWKEWPKIGVTDLQAIHIFNTIPQVTKGLRDHLAHAWIKARDEDEKQGGPNAWALFNVLTRWATHQDEAADDEAIRKGRAAQRFERETRVAKVIEGVAWKELVDA